eukprot:gb/GECG01010781.1/.p1 GENE.gb/GECG01010781.1/~~gb/GECG01010781.1/.p1  ORF type:complete len:689 (+),score=95.45 gb/GECG01010781.1/:1-2067(+)
MAAENTEEEARRGSSPHSRSNSFYGDAFGGRDICIKFVYDGDIRLREVPEEISSFSEIVDMAVHALDVLPAKFGKKAPFRKAIYFTYKDEDGDEICCKELEDLTAALSYIRALGGKRLRLNVCIDQNAIKESNKAGKNGKKDHKKNGRKEHAKAKSGDARPNKDASQHIKTQEQQKPEIAETGKQMLPERQPSAAATQQSAVESPSALPTSQRFTYPAEYTSPTIRQLQVHGNEGAQRDAFGAASRALELFDLLNFVDENELESFVSKLYGRQRILQCFSHILVNVENLLTDQMACVERWMNSVEQMQEFQTLEQFFCKLRKSIHDKASPDVNVPVTELYMRLLNADSRICRQDGILLPRLVQAIDAVEAASKEHSSIILGNVSRGLTKFFVMRLRTAETTSSRKLLNLALHQSNHTITASDRSRASARVTVINKSQSATSEYIPLSLVHREGPQVLTHSLTPASYMPPLKPEQTYSVDVTLDSSQYGTSIYEVWAGSHTHVGNLQLHVSGPAAREHSSCGLRIMNQPSAPLTLNPGEQFRYHFTITNSSNTPLQEAQEIYIQRLSGEELADQDNYCCVLPQLNPWQSYDALLLLRAPGTPGGSYHICYKVTLANGMSLGELSIRINTNNTNAHNVFSGHTTQSDQQQIARELREQFDGIELDTIESILESCGGNRANAEEMLHRLMC